MRTFLPGLLVMFACAPAGKQLPREQVTEPAAALFNGYTKPEVDCYRCHGGDGLGAGRGPSLAERVPGLSDDEVRRTILEGPGKMPSFRDKLTDPELDQLVEWLRRRFDPAASR